MYRALLELGVAGDRKHPVVDPELGRHRLEVRVVAHDHGDLACQLARPVAQQKVVEAVVVAGDEQGHALVLARIGQARPHREALSHLRDRPLETHAVRVEILEIEADALKEPARHGIRVLIGVEDVGAMAVEDLCEGGHDPPLIRAADQQGRGGFRIGRGHAPSLAAPTPQGRRSGLRPQASVAAGARRPGSLR
jgi:hypothetical protein